MNAVSQHPSRDQLVAFGQGRLDGDAAESVAEHVADCDSCCDVLGEVPSDTLASQVRAADADTTIDMRSGKSITRPAGEDRTEIPEDLVDHPRYRIVRVLGAGGMGTVFQAEHRIMDRPVALKVINRELTNDPEVVQRFRQEVRAAAKLSHVNIVTAHDAEQTGELHFLVMEYVEGIDLAHYVRKKGPLAAGLVAHIGRQVAQGLNHAAKHGMVHRDIKPQNLIITTSGRVQILDFGLARLGQKDPERDVSESENDLLKQSAAALTLKGSILGTPDYIAPEQATDSRNADIRADIYSLGCTLYFLLTGRPPFPGGSVLNKLLAHQKETATAIAELRPDVPATMIDIVEKMMSRLPQDRFESPADVAKALMPMARSWQKSGGESVTVARDAAQSAVDRAVVGPAESGETLPTTTTRGAAPPTRMLDGVREAVALNTSLKQTLPALTRSQQLAGVAIAVCCLVAAAVWSFIGDSDQGGQTVPDTVLSESIVDRQRAAASQRQFSEPVVHVSLGDGVELTLVVIPSGEFVMGTTPEQLATVATLARSDNSVELDDIESRELPIDVTIAEPFLIGQTEITVAQFRVFVRQTSWQTDAEKTLGWGMEGNKWIRSKKYFWENLGELELGDDFPVGNISWNDASAFCDWLTRQPIPVANQRIRFRLPVEAEWEYACRAGTTTIWFFGDDISKLSRFSVNGVAGIPRPVPVKSRLPNPFGLYDMAGSDAEWCLDPFSLRDSSMQRMRVDTAFIRAMEQTQDASLRVKRNGSFLEGAFWQRSASRKGVVPTSPTQGGFRVVGEFLDLANTSD